ncbi:MAG: ATPase, T2SS/T4P/T4SS family, partial [bacterium]
MPGRSGPDPTPLGPAESQKSEIVREESPVSAAEAARFVKLKRDLHRQLIESMDLSVLGKMDQDQLRAEVREAAAILLDRSNQLMTIDERNRLINEVIDETFGLGPLESLMSDPSISEIMVNGPKVTYVERNGKIERANIVFNDDKHLVQIIQRIVGRIGRRVDETTPLADARLADG